MREINYLRDVLAEVLRRGKRVAEEYREIRATNSDPREVEFLAGKTQGYYETLSLLLSELEVFGINRQEVGVDDNLSLEDDLL